MFENPSPRLKTFRSEVIWGEVPGDRLVVHWDDSLHGMINYLDEDLYLQVINSEDGSIFRESRINYLAEKEVDVKAGVEYVVRMVVKEKFRMAVATTSEHTPGVNFIPESINRYMLTWSELDWDHIRREVLTEHDVDWNKDIQTALRIERWQADELAPLVEWRYPGMRDMEIVGGSIREITLLVVKKADNAQLKEIFKITLVPGGVKKVLDELTVTTPLLTPFFYLYRVVRETDSSHLRVKWDVPQEMWAEVEAYLKKDRKKPLSEHDLVLRLYQVSGEGTREHDPDNIKKVFGNGDWYFTNLPHGATYFARLVLVNQDTGKEISRPVMVSNDFYIPFKEDRLVLLPIDENRIFAYWHLNKADVWQRLVDKHDAKPGNVEYYIRLFHEWAGGLHHHQQLDAPFHMDYTDSYYMNVEPDKVYRGQLIAVVDGWKVEELTPISNSIQTNRTEGGTAPVSYQDFPQPQDHPTNRRLESPHGTSSYSIGKLIMHLHAHLPFVGQRINYGTSGYWRPGGYIEEWFHEAMRETYIPLIWIFEDLVREGVDFKLSMDISPTLCNMMRNPLLQEEFLNYLDSLIGLAKTETQRTAREEPWYYRVARMHLATMRRCKSTFLRYGRNITRAFKKFQDLGKLEISTCGATHGFLPLMGSAYVEAVRGQIKTAVLDYIDTFGRRPYGIWLPECAYTTGIEKVLQEFGLRYFFCETHTVMNSDSHVDFGVHAPVYLKGSQISVFARDPETGKQVWSGDEGYPGDPDYLEFHIRGGPLKYNRITNRQSGMYKEAYVPEWAEGKAASHAQNFVDNRNFRFQHIRNWFWKKPLVVATYDAELFGHHWYEGPRFLYYMFKKMHYDQNQTELTTPSHYLAEYPLEQEVYLTPSSWGDKGTFDKWMYGSVSWMYRHMNDACSEMIKLTSWAREKEMHHAPADEPGVRILSQMARYLLLSQNSDHGFNMSNGHFVDRIKDMFSDDLKNFWILANMFVKYMHEGDYDEIQLRKLERHLVIFPVIDPFAWSPPL
jgi:predicted glycosyl hydrolase (DUF1957 family)